MNEFVVGSDIHIEQLISNIIGGSHFHVVQGLTEQGKAHTHDLGAVIDGDVVPGDIFIGGVVRGSIGIDAVDGKAVGTNREGGE